MDKFFLAYKIHLTGVHKSFSLYKLNGRCRDAYQCVLKTKNFFAPLTSTNLAKILQEVIFAANCK